MSKAHDHIWYRGEAKRLRDKAAAVKNDEALRNSYLSLACEYDRLADTLEGGDPRKAKIGRPNESAPH